MLSMSRPQLATPRRPGHRPGQRAAHRAVHGLLLGVAALALSGCLTTTKKDPTEGLEFHSARYAQVQRMDAFEACRNEALELDRQARERGSAATYLTSAEVLAKCDREAGPIDDVIPQAERMRLSALAVVNAFRGGDIERARRGLEGFKSRYPDHDLYFADGSSFVASTEALLGRNEDTSFGQFAVLNVNDDLKSEMRRLGYWKNK